MHIASTEYQHLSQQNLSPEELAKLIGSGRFYGYKSDTVNSLILSLLPPVDFEFDCVRERGLIDAAEDVGLFTLRLMVQCLRKCCGFHIPYVHILIYIYNMCMPFCHTLYIHVHYACLHVVRTYMYVYVYIKQICMCSLAVGVCVCVYLVRYIATYIQLHIHYRVQ